jgi:hypothetical protein
MFDDNAEKEKKIVYIFKITLAKFKVVYNFGGNWLQYGSIEHMVPLSVKTQDKLGQHTSADIGYNDSDTWNEKQWSHVGESQMRVTHLKAGYNLIDIIHEPDLAMSFAPLQTFRQALLDKNTLFFIASSKERYIRYWNLTDPEEIEYW